MAKNEKNKTLDEGFELDTKSAKSRVAHDYVIDCNKRKRMGDEPKFTK